MDEYIEREQILGYMDLVVIHARGVAGNDSVLKKVTDIVENMRDLVAVAPSADVVPVVHGRWIHKGQRVHLGVNWWACSVCGDESGAQWMRYCPNCGAQMNEGE